MFIPLLFDGTLDYSNWALCPRLSWCDKHAGVVKFNKLAWIHSGLCAVINYVSLNCSLFLLFSFFSSNIKSKNWPSCSNHLVSVFAVTPMCACCPQLMGLTLEIIWGFIKNSEQILRRSRSLKISTSHTWHTKRTIITSSGSDPDQICWSESSHGKSSCFRGGDKRSTMS